MPIIDFSDFGAKKCEIGAVDTEKLQLVCFMGNKLKLMFADGTVSSVRMKRNRSGMWLHAVTEKMTGFGNIWVDLERIVEIRYFPNGDPENEANKNGKPEIRFWFKNGEFHLRSKSKSFALFMISELKKARSS